MRKRRWCGLAMAVTAAGALAWASAAGLLRIPDRHHPFAPLRVDEAPNWLTAFKLRRLDRDDAQCRAVLAQTALRYTPVEDRDTGAGCGFRNAVRIDATSARVEAFTLSCRSAVALSLWERHRLQPAAQRHYGSAVARIEHFGSYACRDIAGRQGRRSRHATADAFDFAGVVLANGHRVRIAADWDGEAVDAAFLHEIRDGACDSFSTVLSPDYNAAHRDHLHLDRGGFGLCR
ncbi:MULTISPECIES: extensin family protein [Hydrocarboniphaga]|uniref:Extensin family protein n=1 Tax=Hydrocarboniphaga effusa AP103 TaxID=1172194 RepID=I8TCD7_9GAMM|nr:MULTISPECIES: extensin family protein [Hydrocarboniphaga]EIT71585.1 Extensin family protein [Hydrocarboniphaga effusa AP103]MDZ4077549.1 extensin family protein [Hydrocarboniphaga sp.]